MKAVSAELIETVNPNESGNLPVFQVWSDEGVELGLYEAYDADDAVSLANQE